MDGGVRLIYDFIPVIWPRGCEGEGRVGWLWGEGGLP